MFGTNLSLRAVITAAALAQGALARLIVNNWCDDGVYIRTAQGAGCETGKGGCIGEGNKPWHLGPGKDKTTWKHSWAGEAISIKIGKEGHEGILQFEYSSKPEGIWWNLSDLDGEGPGLVGTPFRDDNVGVTPNGNGVGQGTCVKIRCAANSVCLDSYQHPDDPNTKYCPRNTGDMVLDLCMPKDMFSF